MNRSLRKAAELNDCSDMLRVCLFLLRVPLVFILLLVLFSLYQIICSVTMTMTYNNEARYRMPPEAWQRIVLPETQTVFPSIQHLVFDRNNISKIGQMQTTYYDDMNNSDLYMYFQPIISLEERNFMLFTFDIFIRACQRANISYFLYGGTLLGAYRHHGMVPWDDDIDVMLNNSDKHLVRETLSKIPHFGLYSPDTWQWKFYHKGLTTISHKPYRWPFIDIFFFNENKTHIWDNSGQYKDDFIYRKSHVFPLQRRPFEHVLLPVPCHILNSLVNNYLIQVCSTNKFLHKLESGRPSKYKKRVSCRKLYALYAFVFRTPTVNGVLETVSLNGTVTSSMELPNYC